MYLHGTNKKGFLPPAGRACIPRFFTVDPHARKYLLLLDALLEVVDAVPEGRGELLLLHELRHPLPELPIRGSPRERRWGGG